MAKPERWLWAIAFLGMLFRVRATLEDRSLWLDETFLGVNLLHRDLWQLLSLQLEHNQSAPPGFLALTWVSYSLFGQTDFSVRLLPLVSGSLVPLVSVLVSRSVFAGWLPRIVFVSMASLSPILIFYSTEFKQYSIDVLATMIVIFWWANWERLRRSRWVYAVGAVLALCSLTAILMLVLLCSLVLWQALRRDRKLKPWRATFKAEFSPGLIATWATAILTHLVQALFVTPAGFMLQWWSGKDAFAPLPNSLDALLWYPLSLIKLFHLGFTSSASAGPGTDLGLIPVWISGFLLLAFSIYLRSKWLALPALGLASAYLLAVLNLYPFSSRLALYLLPLLFLVLALTLERSDRINYRNQLRLVAIPMTTIFVIMIALATYKFIDPVDFRDTKWALSAVAANARPNQILAVGPDMLPPVNWYLAQGAPIPIEAVEIEWIWEESRFAVDPSVFEAVEGVWTLTALKDESEEVALRTELERFGFTQVCYAFEDYTSVALHVPVELAESKVWECSFPDQK